MALAIRLPAAVGWRRTSACGPRHGGNHLASAPANVKAHRPALALLFVIGIFGVGPACLWVRFLGILAVILGIVALSHMKRAASDRPRPRNRGIVMGAVNWLLRFCNSLVILSITVWVTLRRG